METTVKKYIVEERYVELNERDIRNLIADKHQCDIDNIDFDVSSGGMLRGAFISTIKRSEVKT